MLYLSHLRNISFLSPSSSLLNFKGYPCSIFIPFTLLFPFTTSTCPQITLGTFVLQRRTAAFSTPSFHPHSALHQVFNPCLTHLFADISQRFEWLIPDFGPKYTWDAMKGAAFGLFSVPPIIRKIYNMVLQHRYLVCKLLPHVHRVSTNQEVQTIIITIPKPVEAFWNISTCRMRTLDLQKMLYCCLLSSLCDEQSEVPVQMSGGPGWSLSSARS